MHGAGCRRPWWAMLAKIRSLADKNEPALRIAHTEPRSRKDVVCVRGAHTVNNIRFRKVIVCLGSFSSRGETQTQVTQDYCCPRRSLTNISFYLYLFQSTFASKGVCAPLWHPAMQRIKSLISKSKFFNEFQLWTHPNFFAAFIFRTSLIKLNLGYQQLLKVLPQYSNFLLGKFRWEVPFSFSAGWMFCFYLVLCSVVQRNQHLFQCPFYTGAGIGK